MQSTQKVLDALESESEKAKAAESDVRKRKLIYHVDSDSDDQKTIGSRLKIKKKTVTKPEVSVKITGTKEPTTDASALLKKVPVVPDTTTTSQAEKTSLKRKGGSEAGYTRKKSKTSAKDGSPQEPDSQRDSEAATHPVTQEPSSQREDEDQEAAQIIIGLAHGDLLADSEKLLEEKKEHQEEMTKVDEVINDPIFEESTQEPSPQMAEAAHNPQAPQEPSVQSTDAGPTHSPSHENPDATHLDAVTYSTAPVTRADPLLVASLLKHPDAVYVPPLTTLPLEETLSGIITLCHIMFNVCMIMNSLSYEVPLFI